MLHLTQRQATGKAQTTLTLVLEQRVKSRLRVTLDNGDEAGLMLPRGDILKNGDLLASADGTVVQIIAAAELVSCVRSDDPLLLARVCYHLGNRHVPLEITTQLLRYQHDHVLDDMVRALGLEPQQEHAPFQPEPGAYGEHQSGHTHDHQH